MNLRIKEILQQKGKKAVWLSKEIGVTDVNTRNIINGVVTPKLETLVKIAEALNVPLWQLFASPEDVRNEVGTVKNYVCPKCGAKLEIEIKEV